MLRYLRSSHFDCIDSLGRTPLMMAVQNGHSEVVGLLIDQGAHVELGDRHLRTALHRAVRSYAIYSSSELYPCWCSVAGPLDGNVLLIVTVTANSMYSVTIGC